MAKKSSPKREAKDKTQGPNAGVWLFIGMLSVITLAGYGIAAGTAGPCETIASSDMHWLMKALTNPAFLCW